MSIIEKGDIMKFVSFGLVFLIAVLNTMECATNVNQKNNSGDTALHYAVLSGSLEIVDLLIRNGANVNCQNINGETALMAAAAKGDLSISNLLIEKGSKVNLQNNGGKTVLMYAALEGRNEIENMLISKGADINAKDKSGNTVAYYRNVSKNRAKTDYIERKTWNESWESINDKRISKEERDRERYYEESKQREEERKKASEESRWSTTKGSKNW